VTSRPSTGGWVAGGAVTWPTYLVGVALAAVIGWTAGASETTLATALLTVGGLASAYTATKGGAMLFLLSCAAVAFLHPLFACGLLLVGAVVLAIKLTGILHPVFLFGAPFACYLLAGAPNVSRYRGVVGGDTVRLVLLHGLVLLIACLLVTGRDGRRRESPRRTPIDPLVLLMAAVPGAMGLVLFITQSGGAILHPTTRLHASAPAVFLLETTMAVLAVYSCSVFGSRRLGLREFAVIGALLLVLAMSGYRGWIIAGLAVTILTAVFFHRVRMSPLRLVAVGILFVLVLAGGDAVRRMTTPDLMSTSQVTAAYGLERLPPGVRQVHMVTRESIAVGQRLLTLHRATEERSLLLTDLRTVLPGPQESGGQVMARLFRGTGLAGLTPGAVAVARFDLGKWSYALFVLVGLLIGVLWRGTRAGGVYVPLYIVCTVYSLHFVHRGFPKLSYFAVPTMILVVFWLSGLRGRPRYPILTGPFGGSHVRNHLRSTVCEARVLPLVAAGTNASQTKTHGQGETAWQSIPRLPGCRTQCGTAGRARKVIPATTLDSGRCTRG